MPHHDPSHAEKVKAGIAKAKARGGRIGRLPALSKRMWRISATATGKGWLAGLNWRGGMGLAPPRYTGF